MKVLDFVNKYDLGQLGNIEDIALNIQDIGEMLRNHFLDEIPDIIEEMCNIKID